MRSTAISIGNHLADVEAAAAELAQHGLVERIWRKDHTVWKPESREISDRLGWLAVTEQMRGQVSALERLAQEVRDAGFSNVVLLGMGGSSLGAEVLRQAFGSARGYPGLMVLDSTVPACVQVVAQAIEPEHTLFLVSSKSGTTIEPLSLLRYFRGLVASAVGDEQAGRNFVAITDRATPLAEQAEQEGFRHVFINPSDVGGRFSVLSYFGLVPAALMGIDVMTLLGRADIIRQGCAGQVPVPQNPGAWLGTIIGAMALKGRDKLTLITSPALSSFGLWVEQLIAESTGKEGKGIIPVVGEPLVEPACYSDDRLFICLRLADDDNPALDSALERLRSSGLPLLLLELRDRYDLGAEFFRWELATAVAGAMLGINPFDQPNVQSAKQATERVLRQFVTTGHLPQPGASPSLANLLAEAGEDDYLAILAYIQQRPGVDRVFTDLRRRVLERYHLATSLGYGPRYLHSTGQLHKGGPETGLFLLVTTAHDQDLPIPGQPYTFGVLADAQALGDLEALQASRRPVAWVHLGRGDEVSIPRLLSGLL